MKTTAIRLLLLGATALVGFGQAADSPPAAEQQVVLETDLGAIVIEVFPDKAPNHVAKFLAGIEDDTYIGTTFHRAVPRAIIQGGDPLTKDPRRPELYGHGGLKELKMERNEVSHVRGTVSAVRLPGDPDSAGTQFFICVTNQTQLDGEYTAYGRVVEGMSVVEKISLLPIDASQLITQRVEVSRTYLRNTPPPEKLPFADASRDELGAHRVIVKTDFGEIEIAVFAAEAPRHVRQFLTFTQLGLYNGTPIHRVVPSFVIQGGSINMRTSPIPEKYGSLLKKLQPEFNRHKHLRGAVSMARGSEPDSAMDSFFICLEDQPPLDGRYTVFGEVVRGLDVIDLISLQPLAGETPVKRLPITMEVIRP